MNPVNGAKARAFVNYLKENNLIIKERNYYELISMYKSFTDFLLYCINENKLSYLNYPASFQTNCKLLTKLAIKRHAVFAEIKKASPKMYVKVLTIIADEMDVTSIALPQSVKKDLYKLAGSNITNNK